MVLSVLLIKAAFLEADFLHGLAYLVSEIGLLVTKVAVVSGFLALVNTRTSFTITKCFGITV